MIAIKVIELAKEKKLTTDDIFDLCDSLGIAIKSEMSVLNDSQVKKIETAIKREAKRKVKEAAERMGYEEIITKAGGNIVADTCMVVSPIEEMGYKTTGVNSGKAANYLPGFCKQEVCFANIDDLVEAQT